MSPDRGFFGHLIICFVTGIWILAWKAWQIQTLTISFTLRKQVLSSVSRFLNKAWQIEMFTFTFDICRERMSSENSRYQEIWTLPKSTWQIKLETISLQIVKRRMSSENSEYQDFLIHLTTSNVHIQVRFMQQSKVKRNHRISRFLDTPWQERPDRVGFDCSREHLFHSERNVNKSKVKRKLPI